MAVSLKFLRVQSGMTLEQLAADSGLTRSYLSKIERGLSNPSIASAMTIAKALGVTVERLFGKATEHDAITITRASGGKAGDPGTFLSLVAGTNPERIMRAFIVRPGRKPNRGRIMSHHEGEEVLFVLSGKIEMQLGRRKETLNVGDCVQFELDHPAPADRHDVGESLGAGDHCGRTELMPVSATNRSGEQTFPKSRSGPPSACGSGSAP